MPFFKSKIWTAQSRANPGFPRLFLLILSLLFSGLAAHASDDMLIYSDRFNNGWGDSWSWMPRYAPNNPVYSGSNSMACVPSGSW